MLSDCTDGGSKAGGFAAIWSTLMVLLANWGGSKVLQREWVSPLAYGIFHGSVVALSQLALCLFAVFVGLAKEKEAAIVSPSEGLLSPIAP